jgi:metal transporter CNNM
MTPVEMSFMLGVDEKLSFETIGKIFKTGYSRIPIYEVSKSNVVGILLVKDLIFIDPEDAVPIRSFIQIFGRSIHAVGPDDTLGEVLVELKKGRSHLAVVRDVNNENESQDTFYEVKGIITLEGKHLVGGKNSLHRSWNRSHYILL